MSSLAVGAFVRSYAGHFITGAFTLVATGGLIWDNHKGRRDAVDKLDTKIDGVKVDVSRVEKNLEKVHEDV
ncbi:hypothetical protein P167DRAFT_532756 [Morchella conica CCBAS932]|uniref:Uncharacterized protein n=1 Tax=Morchella conica CCBAS932 TaxID=1392247 RepID=A0A3N4LCU5_9PEZI|nr:hypothetical protein P167DRAFT_532756 [Morchella conica CCBAS932]